MLNWLFRSRKLSGFEKLLLGAVVTALPEPAAAKLTAQLKEINLVQRLARGVEVNFYAMRRRQVFWDEDNLFRVSDAVKLAKVRICSEEIRASVDATIWIVHGHIASIEYSMEPDALAGSDPIRIEEVALLIDPVALFSAG